MSKFNNISIRNKLIIIQSATALIALVICCSIFVFNGIATFKGSTVRKMFSIAHIVGDNSVAPLMFVDQDAAKKTLQNLSKEPDVLNAMILDKSGNVFAAYTRPGASKDDHNYKMTAENNQPRTTYQFQGDRLYVLYKIYQDNSFVGTLAIRSELAEMKQIIRNYVLAASMVLFVGLLSAIVISFFLQQTISSRLLMLVVKTKEVAQSGNYNVRVWTEDKDEIGILSKEFNAMMMQIDNMQKSLKDANSDLEKRVEQRTAELENANKELESFSYTVSHDLKAPLRAINGFTEILMKKYGDKLDEKAKEITDVIIANARKMGQLIEDLLEFSRLGRKEFAIAEVSMAEIVEQVAKDVKAANEGRNVELTIEPLPPTHGDRNLLIQVWTNLIANAFKYSSHKEKSVITIGSFKKGDDTVYFIKDNGAGFDMRYADKLFRVFQRLHGANEFEGTGVGLAIVSRIISRHGGKVWAEGKVDEGATFYFSLP